MPSFTSKTFASFYKNILGIDQSSNTGVDTTTRAVQDGAGNSSAISLSDDVLQVQPINDDTTAFAVKSQSGSAILSVDTSSSLVKAGLSQINTLTLFKEMGLYDFSPAIGFHYPLIANTMFVPSSATAFSADSDWGDGDDPSATLDVSGLTQQENAIAVYWYLDNNITLDSVRYMVTTDGSDTLNFHLEAYTLDVSSNHGDLSAGYTHASAHSVSTAQTTVLTGLLSLDSADIDASKVVIGFVESDSTTDVSVSFNIKYHIR